MISTHIQGFDPRKVPLNFRALHTEPLTNRERLIAALERQVGKRAAAPFKDATVITAAGSGSFYSWAKRLFSPAAVSNPNAEKSTGDLASLKSRVEAGDALAEAELALRYLQGDGVPRNDEEALRLYRLSAAQGNPLGQNGLGWMLMGAAGNDVESVRLFQLAVAQGARNAHRNLGLMYLWGRGVKKNEPLRICRRLQLLRRWSYDSKDNEQVFA